jgi:MFS family permease
LISSIVSIRTIRIQIEKNSFGFRNMQEKLENISKLYFVFQVKSFGAWIGADEQFNSVLFGGLLGSLFSFLQFVASPLVGGLSDHFGRRPLLLLSTAGVALSYALWANASTFGLFVLARIIGGLSKGMDFFIVWT